MSKRESKPFMVTAEQIEDYLFTKKQIKAYEALKKATERCKNSGLTLIAKQDKLCAYPSKFMNNHMTVVSGQGEQSKGIKCPLMWNAYINDAGADDTEYIKDQYIK